MRDAIAWSHDLLTPEEQTLFQRLAVFPGGCTLDAAEAVVDPRGERLDVFDGIASLVDKSLLRQEETEGEPRFRMLETVREFGLERLEGSGTGEETRRQSRRLVPGVSRGGPARSHRRDACNPTGCSASTTS